MEALHFSLLDKMISNYENMKLCFTTAFPTQEPVVILNFVFFSLPDIDLYEHGIRKPLFFSFDLVRVLFFFSVLIWIGVMITHNGYLSI